ncbi:MAG: hypothetical protein HQK52_00220 [Oligoflexia bacterium]|nr:hypothetical protein [Oligoflexia bacterium]
MGIDFWILVTTALSLSSIVMSWYLFSEYRYFYAGELVYWRIKRYKKLSKRIMHEMRKGRIAFCEMDELFRMFSCRTSVSKEIVFDPIIEITPKSKKFFQDLYNCCMLQNFGQPNSSTGTELVILEIKKLMRRGDHKAAFQEVENFLAYESNSRT